MFRNGNAFKKRIRVKVCIIVADHLTTVREYLVEVVVTKNNVRFEP